MKKRIQIVVFVSLFLLSGFASAMQCRPAVNELSVAAKPEKLAESAAIVCDLSGESAIYLGGELSSSLVRAQGFVEATFLDARGVRLWSARRGPWMGTFTKLNLDESLAVPVGAVSVRVVLQAQSRRPDASGLLRGGINIKPGVLVVGEVPNGNVISTNQRARWKLSSIPARVNGEYVLELRDQSGKLVDGKRIAQDGEEHIVIDMGALPVGYFDVQVKFVSSQKTTAIWHSSLAVLPPGVAPNEVRFGMDAALSWYGGGNETIVQSVAMMRQAGIGSVRDRMAWSKVQPDSRHTDWIPFQPAAEAVAKAGMDSVQVFHDAPRWVRHGGVPQNDRQPPLDDAAVYAFGRAYAQGLGRTVRSVEYWNEQNTVFFAGYPYHYASGFKAFSAGVKSIDPSIRVLIGSAAGRPGKFFEEIYKNGVSPFMDTRNQHYYGINADVDTFAATSLAVLEHDGGVSNAPGWLTEMGYSLQRDAQGDIRASEREQAAHLVKTFASGFLAGYERVFFFFWRELVEADFQTWGIVREDMSPRPAYVALSLLTRHLEGASLVAAENHGAGRTVYFRRSSGGYVAVTWGDTNLSRLGSSLVIRDIYGKVVSPGSQEARGVVPLLLSEIEALPPTARTVSLPTQPLRGAAPLRLSIKVAVDGKDEGLPGRNSAVLGVGEGGVVDVSGRIFATGKSAPSLECLAGPGVTVLSPGKSMLANVAANGEPFACRFKASLLSVGESFVSVRVKDGANSDIARVALVPDATASPSSSVRTVLLSGVCPRWVARNSANSSLAIQSLSQGVGVCPPVSMTSRINRRGETWVFPAAQMQGDVLAGANGIRLRVNMVPGYVLPPTPLMMQLVERTGGIWLVELRPASDRKVLSGLFKLAHAAPWARDDNGRLDLANVREVMIGWGGYAGEVGQQHAYVIEEFGLM